MPRRPQSSVFLLLLPAGCCRFQESVIPISCLQIWADSEYRASCSDEKGLAYVSGSRGWRSKLGWSLRSFHPWYRTWSTKWTASGRNWRQQNTSAGWVSEQEFLFFLQFQMFNPLIARLFVGAVWCVPCSSICQPELKFALNFISERDVLLHLFKCVVIVCVLCACV